MATGLPTAYRHIREHQRPLRFADNGKFRILHLTDIHEVPIPTADEEYNAAERRKSTETIEVIRRCIELAKPDLVIFGGDCISGYRPETTYEYMRETLKRIVEPVADKNIPLAVIFGNHDSETVFTQPFTHRENQMCIYAEYGNLRSTMNDADIFGCGNCSLPILRSDSNRIAWNIWCIDSNDCIRQPDFSRPVDLGYDYVHEDQLNWREQAAEQLAARNGGKPVPSLLFQHIPLLQVYDILAEADRDEAGAFEKFGKYYKVPDGAFVSGALREPPCPTNERRDEFESWKKTGDIVAAFFGHDHSNDFTYELDGIRLVQTPAVRYHAGTGIRGGRLIVIDENIPDSYETKVYQFPLFGNKW